MFLKTDRLILRPFEADDLECFAAINADLEVMQFFPAPLTAHETADMVARWADKHRRYGFAFAAVETQHDQQLIGMAGLSQLESDGGCPLWHGTKASPPRRRAPGLTMVSLRWIWQRY